MPEPTSRRRRGPADRLARGLDARIAGDPADLEPLDRLVVERLMQLGAVPPARRAFVSSLRENLMKTSLAAPRLPAPSPIVVAPTASGTQRRPSVQVESHPTRRLSAVARRVPGFAATGLLMLVVAALAFVALRPASPTGSPTASAPVAAQASASPESPGADPRWTCLREDPYQPCPAPLLTLGTTLVRFDGLPDASDVAVSRVQLQGWQVDPNGSVERILPNPAPAGIMIDFVLTGSYVGTFDVPVSISRPNRVLGSERTDVPAGSLLELVSGDTVAYPVGRQTSLRNPATTRPLTFKRAIFADDEAAFAPNGTASTVPNPGVTVKRVIGTTGWTMTVDGDSTLPKPLNETSAYEAGITLQYVWEVPGAPFPPTRIGRYGYDIVAIGPVDPVSALDGDPQQGYILMVGEPKG